MNTLRAMFDYSQHLHLLYICICIRICICSPVYEKLHEHYLYFNVKYRKVLSINKQTIHFIIQTLFKQTFSYEI